MKDVEQIVRDIISEVSDVRLGLCTLDARIVEDLEMDSLSLVELLFELEDEFKFLIDDDEFLEIKTVRHAVEIIRRRLDEVIY